MWSGAGCRPGWPGRPHRPRAGSRRPGPGQPGDGELRAGRVPHRRAGHAGSAGHRLAVGVAARTRHHRRHGAHVRGRGLAVLAAGRGAVAWATAARAGRDRSRAQPAWPAVAFVLAGGTALVTGAHHFQNAWPGTGGTAGHRGLVPAGAAAFGWAATLSVSSYWAHPAALTAFPGPELAWMVLSPLALVGLVGGAVAIVRRQPLPARLLSARPAWRRPPRWPWPVPRWRRVLGVRAGLGRPGCSTRAWSTWPGWA